MKNFLLATVGLVALVGMAAPRIRRGYGGQGTATRAASGDLQLERFLHRASGGWAQSNSCLNFVDAFGVDFGRLRLAVRGVVGSQISYRWQASQWCLAGSQGDW
jgi:outer membrane immunogenic protein